ncbi:MAG TPA: Do family serine endopeptidase [Polyangiaceae bacterium]|jgi:serine protease Do
MTSRNLIPLSVLLLAFGAGCQGSASAAAPLDTTPQSAAPFATPPVLPGTPDIATLAARVKPAVVNITTVQQVKVPRMDMPDVGELFPFFNQGGVPNGAQRHRGSEGGDAVMKQQALGSGFIVDPSGRVVTNAHVVDGADVVKVRLADDREYRAKVVGKDRRLDVAVLQLEGAPHDLPAVSLGGSEALRVGEYVVAIGNPFGLGNTVTMGIVSAKGRTIGAGPYDDFIQTDASINPGNSGGPLFNLRGQVVGINTAINPQGKGIGFAIPIDAVKDVYQELVTTGHVSRGQLGVVIQGMDEDLAKAVGLDRPKGALVEEVAPGSPAEKAGIKAGDVVLALDGRAVAHSEDLPRMVASHHPGTQVKLAVLSDKQTRDVSLTLSALEDKQDRADADDVGSSGPQGAHTPSLGVGVDDENGKVVVESVRPDGPCDGKLRPGDVIEEVNHQSVRSAGDLSSKVQASAADKPLLLRVRRGDQSRYVAVERSAS